MTYFKFNFLNSRSVLTVFSIKKKKKEREREMKYSMIMDNMKTGLMWYENILLCANSVCSLSEYVPLWSLSTFGFSFRLPFGFSNFNYIVSQSLITRVWQRGVLNYQRTYSDTQACAFLFVSIWPILLQQISNVHDGSGPVFTSSVDVSQLRACPFIWCPSCIRK